MCFYYDFRPINEHFVQLSAFLLIKTHFILKYISHNFKKLITISQIAIKTTIN